MSYGIIEYNEEGLVKCEICGKYFNRVSSHVRQKHGISAIKYKETYGFDKHKGICSKKSALLSRQKTLLNYHRCVSVNLLAGGKKTRFKKGDPGRTKDKVSEQTMIRLKKNIFPK